MLGPVVLLVGPEPRLVVPAWVRIDAGAVRLEVVVVGVGARSG
jgi:hypothetical protein